jgi:signal recognition particle GTPase
MKKTKTTVHLLIEKYEKEKSDVIIMDDYDAGRVEEMTDMIMQLKQIIRRKDGLS